MNEVVISPELILSLIGRYWRSMLAAFIGAVLLVMAVYTLLPRVYQAQTMVYISGNYFQNPLLGELVAQSMDSSELKSERERIVKESLGTEFLTAEGEKFHLFRTAPTDLGRGQEVEALEKSIDGMLMSPTEYSIKIKARSAEAADGMVRDAIESIRAHMYQHRVQTFQQILDVLSGEIAATTSDEIGRTRAQIGAGGLSQGARAQLQAQIEVVQNRIEDLLHTYNEQHPAIQKAKAELAELRAIERGRSAPSFFQKHSGGDGKDDAAMGETSVKDELMRKKHLVNIALEIERHDSTMSQYFSVVSEPLFPKVPIFPKLALFAVIALCAGVFAAVVLVGACEYWARSAQNPTELKALLKTEILGTLVVRPESSDGP